MSALLVRLAGRHASSARMAELACLPHILLHGTDDLLLRCVLDVLLTALVTGSVSPIIRLTRRTDCDHTSGFPHWSNQEVLVIDAAELSTDQRASAVSHIQQMAQHECLNPRTRRHIIAITNIHRMSSTMAHALRRIVEDGAPRCLFIFTSRGVSQVDAALRSRTACMRCGCSLPAAIAAAAGVEMAAADADALFVQAGGSVTCMLLLMGAATRTWKSSLIAFLQATLQTCVAEVDVAAARKRKMTNAEERRVHDAITRAVHVIETTGTKHADVFHALLHVGIEMSKQRGCTDEVAWEWVELVANANANACSANKHTFALEAALLEAFDLLAK